MRAQLCLLAAVLMLSACSRIPPPPSGRGERATPVNLHVDSALVAEDQRTFVQRLQETGLSASKLTSLYAEAIDVVGANGILAGILEVWPTCHEQAHPLGRIVYRRLGDLDLSLRTCGGECHSGCLHGVLMEAFSVARELRDPEGHVDPLRLAATVNELCRRGEEIHAFSSPGLCAHGVGHAFTVLAEYDTPAAVEFCDRFDLSALDYYCAMGAYMEYAGGRLSGTGQSALSSTEPCARSPYPAACFPYRFQLLPSVSSVRGDPDGVSRSCERLRGAARLGCFHGLGSAHAAHIRMRQRRLSEICLRPEMTVDDRRVCVEGAVENLAGSFPREARELCEWIEGDLRGICERAADREVFSMEKDLTLYQRE